MRRLLVLLCFVTSACSGGCNSSRAAGADLDGGRDGGRPLVDGGARGAATGAALDGAIADEMIPAPSSEDLSARSKHLLEALTQDNPELAADMMFPRDGYVAVRDVSDPSKVWEKQIKVPFGKTIKRLHKAKKGIERAQFVSIEIGHAVVQSTPKKREWKKPLWKVRHAKLTFTIDGKTQRIDIAEMTAWRGAWYVTRLR